MVSFTMLTYVHCLVVFSRRKRAMSTIYKVFFTYLTPINPVTTREENRHINSYYILTLSARGPSIDVKF